MIELRPTTASRVLVGASALVCVLGLGAELEGDLADGLRVINTSPLAKMTGGALRSWQAGGVMALRLDLDMPFGGRLTPENSRLDLTADIARERHNQEILQQMNRRAELQLRLQDM